MVQTYSHHSTVPLPFSLLAPAYFLRYPNPFATHVLSVDVLDRLIVQRGETPVLLTSRLLLKKGTLPRWAPRGLIKNAESWVLEVSEVDLEPANAAEADGNAAQSSSSSSSTSSSRQMRTWTRNLDHTTVLAVAEGLTFTELLRADPKGKQREWNGSDQGSSSSSAAAGEPSTHCLTSAHITSDVSVIWKRIEKFGLKRFMAHMDTSRQGLLYAASRLSDAGAHPSSSSGALTMPTLPPAETARYKLRESLRPPWLDGLPLSPMAKMRQWADRATQRYRNVKEEGLWGYTGRREREEGMRRWRDELRERLVKLRTWGAPQKEGAGATSSTARTEGGQAETQATDAPDHQQQQERRQQQQPQPQKPEEESIEVQRERLARLLHERPGGSHSRRGEAV